MPSPEQGGRRPDPEREPTPYYRASRFDSQAPAAQAYGQIQDLLFAERNKADLSAYRLLLDTFSLVVVLGTPPPPRFERKIEGILAGGEPVALAPDLLSYLQQRREESRQLGTWVERHHRPGKRP